MTFEEALRKSIRAYYADQGFDSYSQAKGKDVKYTKKYFDDKEELLLGEEDSKEDMTDGE